jgi:hypothetical protein
MVARKLSDRENFSQSHETAAAAAGPGPVLTGPWFRVPDVMPSAVSECRQHSRTQTGTVEA